MLKSQTPTAPISPIGPISPTEVSPYFYAPRGRGFRIYRRESQSSAIPMPDEPIYLNREQARKRVYELNGWRYKPCKTN